MLEFVFFHQPICNTFTAYLESLSVRYQLEEDDDYINVAISEDIDEGRIEEIENLYDRLLDESRDQVNSDEGESTDNYQKASLLITLGSGDTTYAHVDSDMLNRVMQVISKDELNQLISAIVDAVENQDDRSYCQIVKESGSLPSQS